MWTLSYLAQILVRRHAFSLIFGDICVFKEAKATVTAARNTASVLQRHTATLTSAIAYRLCWWCEVGLCGRQTQKQFTNLLKVISE